MKQLMLDEGLRLILENEGYSLRPCDLDRELESQLMTVVEKWLELLKSTNDFMKLYLKID